MIKRFILFWVVALALPLAAQAQGVDKEVTKRPPHEVVEVVTETLLADIAKYREALEKADSEEEEEQLLNAFFDDLTETLETVVHFDWIALNVMGQYRKQASDEQQERFRKTFKESLVETYGRGLLTFSDQDIEVFPPDEDIGDKRRATVKQEIRGKDATYPLQYSMGKTRDGEWQVINVIINGINLGKTFRNQFISAARSHGGDIDKVIDNWSPSKIEEEVQEDA